MELTEFQKEVLKEVSRIPKGEVRTYAQIARAIGRPKAARAVGNALARNPYTPKIPCHRVIRSTGSAGGYSAKGGRKRKIELLKREGAL
ncbi:6-O-methylguanine DNA methyltransferase [Candidatus Micrarchaeota archaeon]|nr:MAG: 6-O-methylguanine DNA methyltransferase [Candidatus Micrarchaeota archaeon]